MRCMRIIDWCGFWAGRLFPLQTVSMTSWTAFQFWTGPPIQGKKRIAIELDYRQLIMEDVIVLTGSYWVNS